MFAQELINGYGFRGAYIKPKNAGKDSQGLASLRTAAGQ